MCELDFEQRQRLETEVLPAVIGDPEYAAVTIVRLEAERDALRAENKELNEVIQIVRHDSWGQAGVIEKLEALVAELTSLLMEAVNEMEPDIEAKYEAADVLAYPSMARKYEQDMDLPRRIRAALAKKGER